MVAEQRDYSFVLNQIARGKLVEPKSSARMYAAAQLAAQGRISEVSPGVYGPYQPPTRRRDFSSEYRRRQERAQREGFSSYWEQRQFRSQLSRLEVTDRAGFTAKRDMLRRFNVTAAEFERMRRANQDYDRPHFENWRPRGDAKRRAKRQKAISDALRLNQYNVDIDLDIDNWSEQRVGYITSFYRAIVDPRYNYAAWKSKTGTRRQRELTNRYQADLLVKYAGIMGITEFERRYGADPR